MGPSFDPAEFAPALFAETSDALFVFDGASKRILDANPAAERLTACSRAQLLASTLADHLCGDMDALRASTDVFRALIGFSVHGVPVALTVLRSRVKPIGLLIAQTGDGRLREAQQRFDAFMNTIPMLGFILDEGRLIYVNQALLNAFGRPAEYFLGKTPLELYPPEVGQQLEEHNRQALAGNRPLEQVERVPTPDGVLREWWTLRLPFADARGRTVLGCLALDLTERRQMEESLRRTEERYRSLWQRNLAGIVRATLAGRILDCNDSFARLFGFASCAEALKHSTTELYFDPGVRAEFVARLREAGHLTNYEMQMRRADGTPIWVIENVSLLIEDGEEILEGTLIDISDRKHIEEALRASEATNRTLIEHLDQAIFLKDRELRYVTANPIFCASVGKTESELRGKTISELFPPNPFTDMSREIEKCVLAEGRAIEMEEVIRVGGRPRTVRIARTPVRDPAGTIVGVLGICWDVTEQRALEAQVRHVHKMDAIGQLAGGIAHDFNNLLTIMLGNLSFALKENADFSTVLELLRNAEKAGLRAAELTKTLLGFSRQAALATTPIDVHTVIDEVVALLRPTLSAHITLEVQRQSSPWVVQADTLLIHQVLTNLTLNARDALPGGGKIVYEVSHFAPEPSYLAKHVEARAGEFVRLRVQDTGVGIAPEVKQRIFEPFFTTKEKGKGTGLGLAIVFSIVKQHHGWIVCDSEPGRGTTFDLFLPRCAVNIPAPVEVKAAPAPPKQPVILLVDDERMIRQLTKTILDKAGFEVVVAEHGEMAIELYRERHQDFALVILDAVMPKLTGRETLRVLSGINANVPVLFSSGYSTEQVDVNEFPQVRGFLAKPYRAEQLVQKVNEIVRG